MAQRDPRGVASLAPSKSAYRPAAVLGSQQANAQADRNLLRQMMAKNLSIYQATPNPPARALSGKAPDHADAFALQAGELFFRPKTRIDPMGVTREMQGHRRNVANESIHGVTNLRGINVGHYRPGITPAGQTGPSQLEKDKTELTFVEAEKNVVCMGIIAKPDSDADSGSGNTTTHLNAVVTQRNTSNVDWPAGALGAFHFPRPWELPQGADTESARSGIRPTAWLVPVDRKTFEWDQAEYMRQSLKRVDDAIKAGGPASGTLAFWEQDSALSQKGGDVGKQSLILSEETDRIWYHLVASEVLRRFAYQTKNQQQVPAVDITRLLGLHGTEVIGAWNHALDNQDRFRQTVQRATMALRGLVGKFDSTIVCRFLTSAPKGGEAEIYMRS